MLRGVLLTLLLLVCCCCGFVRKRPSEDSILETPSPLSGAEPNTTDEIKRPIRDYPNNNLRLSPEDPCFNICGVNTDCQIIDNVPVCTCKEGFNGQPFTGCLPLEKAECTSNSQCPAEKACLNSKCIDACSGVCGLNMDCRVADHKPVCACRLGFRWKSSVGCQPESSPECMSDAMCAPNLACRSQLCVDPCAGVCGNNTVCRVIDHHPACACASGYTGNPFEECNTQCSSALMRTDNSKLVDRMPKERLHLHKERMVWQDALVYCRSRDMHLVSINSEDEQLEVNRLLESSDVTSTHTWTSGARIDHISPYLWTTDGTAMEYTNWKSGEPSGDQSIYKCIGLNSGGRWITLKCNNGYFVMCEVDLNVQ